MKYMECIHFERSRCGVPKRVYAPYFITPGLDKIDLGPWALTLCLFRGRFWSWHQKMLVETQVSQAYTSTKSKLFITRAFQRKRLSSNSGLVSFSFGRKSQPSPYHACATFWLSRMCDVLTNEHTAWSNGGRREAFAEKNQHRDCV